MMMELARQVTAMRLGMEMPAHAIVMRRAGRQMMLVHHGAGSLHGLSRTTTLLIVFSLAVGCAGVSHDSADTTVSGRNAERHCGPPADFVQAVSSSPLPSQVPFRTSSDRPRPAVEGFSPQSLEIADTIGALPIVLEIPYLEHEAAQNNTEASLRLLRAHQLLSDRILLALLDVKSAAAEADCEEERADQLADRLQEQRDIQTRRLTIFAILGGGVLGILSGGLAWAAPASVGQGIAGVAAGTVESSLGTAALFDDTQYHFQHSRNLLQEVWEGPAAPSLLPSSVWRFLNRPLREGSTMRTLRETLIARWHQDGRFDKPGSETELRRVALFFGAGGLYKIEELRARAAMLDRLEADINLMSHDLERLMRETLTRDPVLSPILR